MTLFWYFKYSSNFFSTFVFSRDKRNLEGNRTKAPEKNFCQNFEVACAYIYIYIYMYACLYVYVYMSENVHPWVFADVMGMRLQSTTWNVSSAKQLPMSPRDSCAATQGCSPCYCCTSIHTHAEDWPLDPDNAALSCTEIRRRLTERWICWLETVRCAGGRVDFCPNRQATDGDGRAQALIPGRGSGRLALVVRIAV